MHADKHTQTYVRTLTPMTAPHLHRHSSAISILVTRAHIYTHTHNSTPPQHTH